MQIERNYYKKLVINNGGISNATNNDAAQGLNPAILINKDVEDLSWRFKGRYVNIQKSSNIDDATQQMATLLTTVDNYSIAPNLIASSKTDSNGVFAIFNMSKNKTSNLQRAAVKIPWGSLVVIGIANPSLSPIGTAWVESTRVKEFLAQNTDLFESGGNILFLPPGIKEQPIPPAAAPDLGALIQLTLTKPLGMRPVSNTSSVYMLGRWAPMNIGLTINDLSGNPYPHMDLITNSTYLYSFGGTDSDGNAQIIGISMVPWHYGPMIFEDGLNGVFADVQVAPEPPIQTMFSIGNELQRDLISYSII